MAKVINELFKTLRGERSSKEAGTSRFSTHNIIDFLGNYDGVLSVLVLSFFAWLIIIILVSCGSGKNTFSEKSKMNEITNNIVSEAEKVNSAETYGKMISISDSSGIFTERQEKLSKNSEIITITETTIYDTGDSARSERPKVSKTIKQTKIEKCGASASTTQTEVAKKTTSQVTKENKAQANSSEKSAALTSTRRTEVESLTDKQQSVSESKQTYYIALTLIGIALVILASILARWVFSKYRRRSGE